MDTAVSDFASDLGIAPNVLLISKAGHGRISAQADPANVRSQGGDAPPDGVQVELHEFSGSDYVLAIREAPLWPIEIALCRIDDPRDGVPPSQDSVMTMGTLSEMTSLDNPVLVWPSKRTPPVQFVSKQCLQCVHHRGSRCDAFPEGIPRAIALSRHDHQQSFPGDCGVRFEPTGDADYLDNVLAMLVGKLDCEGAKGDT